MVTKNIQKILALLTINKQSYEWYNKDPTLFNHYRLNIEENKILGYICTRYPHALRIMAEFLSSRRSQNSQKYLPLFYKLIGHEKWNRFWESYLHSQIHSGMLTSNQEAMNFSEFIKEHHDISLIEKSVLKFEYAKLEVLYNAKQFLIKVAVQETSENSYPFINPAYQVVYFNFDILQIINDIKNNSVGNYIQNETKLLICSTWDGLNSVVLKFSSQLFEIIKLCKGRMHVLELHKLLSNTLNNKLSFKNIFEQLNATRIMAYCLQKVE